MQQQSVSLAQVVLESHAILAEYGSSLETDAWLAYWCSKSKLRQTVMGAVSFLLTHPFFFISRRCISGQEDDGTYGRVRGSAELAAFRERPGEGVSTAAARGSQIGQGVLAARGETPWQLLFQPL